jgi:TRAP-type transport system small permease protein
MTLPHGGQVPDPDAFDEDSDEHLDLSDIGWDDSLVFITFWGLAFVVFLQFFTRYVLNDSYTWTEEIARYMLIWVTFFGLFMVVRKQSNVAVEVFYRWFPMWLRRVLSSVVDVVAVLFYGAMTWLCIELSMRTQQSMTSIDWPKSVIYWGAAFGLAVSTLYAIAIAWRHWRTQSSPLIRTGGAIAAPDRPGMD